MTARPPPLVTRPTRQRPPSPFARLAWWRLALALLPLGCVALSGGTANWSQGITLLLLGAVLLAMPPGASLGRGIDRVLGALLLLALTAFLPARWLPWPAWRSALTEDFHTALPATFSPQPWLSAESLVLFVAGMAWFYRMATMRWTDGERLRAARFFAVGTVVLAAMFVTFYKLGITVPFWINERNFGPFPNRNQTADFLGVAALPVLACAYVSWRGKRRPAAVGWLVGWLVLATAVFNNFSRAGVGLLFGGTAAYLAVEAVRAARNRRPPLREVKEGDPLPDVALTVARWRRVALATSLLLMLGSGFFLFGGDTLGRFQFDSTAGVQSVVTDEFRGKIQRDAVGMIAGSPWCGVGLGNFAPIFELFRHRSARPLWIVHPESDWLWMAGELGWPALALALAGGVLLARRVGRWPRGIDRPLRTAAAMAVGLFALHGLVDVSAHRLGTAFCVLFLLGLAMPGPGPGVGLAGDAGERDALWPARVFRGLGVVFMAVGLLWLVESAGWITAPGATGVDRLKAQVRRLGRAGDYVGAERAATQALAWAPLDWELNFARGAARVYLRRDPATALEDFRRARYLQPFAGGLCHMEAGIWAAADQPSLAVSALAEACRREPDQAAGYISDVTSLAVEGKPAFRERFRYALRHDPTLELAYLHAMDPAETGPVLAAMEGDDPDLRGFSDAQTAEFLRLRAQNGDAPAVVAAMDVHPAWQRVAWRWWATACARAGSEERACGIATRSASAPVVPPAPAVLRPLAELQAEAARAPKDPAEALRLYRAQSAAGNGDAAMSALHQIAIQPGCPAYFFYLEALQAARIGKWHDGWEAWQRYLEKAAGQR